MLPTEPNPLRTLRDIGEALRQDGLPHELHPSRGQIILPVERGDLVSQLVLIWPGTHVLFQALLALPFEVPPGRLAPTALAIARINHVLTVPGFGLDPEHGTVYFRVVQPRRADGSIDKLELQRACTTVVHTAADFLAPLLDVALHGASPDGVLRRP